MKIILVTLAAFICTVVDAFTATTPVSTLLTEHRDQINRLEEIAGKYANAPTDPIFYLRYCLGDKADEDVEEQLKSTLEWRQGDGADICASATAAINLALSSDTGPWDNAPVRDMAPHASIVNKYITPSQCLTTPTNSGDLCYIIRASRVDDVALMSEVSVEQMTEFFLYCKEVNFLVANMRSAASDKLACVVTANDLAGVKLIGGDATFRKALSASSNKANELYPNLSGPTFLLNLPKLVRALVKLFTPLFSAEVRKKLKFEKGPLNNVDELTELVTDQEKRKLFLSQVDDMLA
mmetsp:Transcript_9266/g.13616  ORF Transcript_9266/g.13616 Transcript_9266/m.13616 type:complete len:295 (+) Transcript_9266:43-927(+)